MVGLVSSRVAPSLPADIGTGRVRKSAEIVKIGKAKLPPLPDYAKACAELIARTFPASSRHAISERAALETGRAGSSDTFERILAGDTKHPDGHLMQCVLIIAHNSGIAIPPALAVRVPA